MSSINVYRPEMDSNFDVLPLMLSFYGRDHEDQQTTLDTLRIISYMLNFYAIGEVLPKTGILSSGTRPEGMFLIPILRAGIGMLPESVVQLYNGLAHRDGIIPRGTPIVTGCIGASRPGRPDLYPASVYLNTIGERRLDDSIAVVLEVGESTFSTGEAISKELRDQGLDPTNLIFITGAACVDQTRDRASRHLPGGHWVVGSEWFHREEEGPGQYYLDEVKLYGDRTARQSPVDWGEAVAEMRGREGSVDYFLDKIVAPVISLTPKQRDLLHREYIKKERDFS